MKFALNVISSSLIVTAVAIVLAACSSQESMRGRVSTDEEVKQFCSKDANAKACLEMKLIPKPGSTTSKGGTAAPVAGTDGKPGSSTTTPAPGAPAAPAAPVAPGTAPEAPVKSDSKVVKPKAASEQTNLFKTETKIDGASNKIIVEYADHGDLTEANELAMRDVNEDAKLLVQGLTTTFSGSDADLRVSIDAAVNVNGVSMNLYVLDAPIIFNKDGKVSPIEFKLQDLTGADDQDPTHKIKVSVICTGPECVEIQLRIDFLFENGSKTVPAVFMFEKVNNFGMVSSNLGDVTKIPSFQEARGAKAPLKPVVRPVAKPKVEVPAPAPAPTATPKVPATPATPGKDAAPKTPASPGESTATPSNKPKEMFGPFLPVKKDAAPAPKVTPAPTTPPAAPTVAPKKAPTAPATPVQAPKEKQGSVTEPARPFTLVNPSPIVAQKPVTGASKTQVDFAKTVSRVNSGKPIALNIVTPPEKMVSIGPAVSAPVVAAKAPAFKPIAAKSTDTVGLMGRPAPAASSTAFQPISTGSTPSFVGSSFAVASAPAAAAAPAAKSGNEQIAMMNQGLKAAKARREAQLAEAKKKELEKQQTADATPSK